MDMVNHPAHYDDTAVSRLLHRECLEYTRHMGFCDGNAFKYVWRCFDKNVPEQDLNKAEFYLKDCAKYTPINNLPVELVAELAFYVDNADVVREATDSHPLAFDQISILHTIAIGQYGDALNQVTSLTDKIVSE